MAEAGGQGFCLLMPPVRLEMASAHDTQAWVGGAAHSGNGGLNSWVRLQNTGGCHLLSLTQATGPQINLGGVGCLAALFWGPLQEMGVQDALVTFP